jgi:pimeloyl-ACP methyl ester carboxylesterase
MPIADDVDLVNFEAEGLRLPVGGESGYMESTGARIWYASFGYGSPVLLLHGGLGHSGNWAKQIPALLNAGYRAIVVDSRGHGRSTRGQEPYTYELLASDIRAVMDGLGIQSAPLVGWSDGACTALVLADESPERVDGVFFFACNMDPSGTKEVEFTPILGRCFSRHQKDYRELSETPDDFAAFADAIQAMQSSQPNYSADDLAGIQVPVSVVLGEHDEFIRREHAEYLARTIPRAEFILIPGLSHFAPLQKAGVFNSAVAEFLANTPRKPVA